MGAVCGSERTEQSTVSAFTHGPFRIDAILPRDIVTENGRLVATIYTGDITEDPQAEALARLFVASPKMLGALKLLQDQLYCPWRDVVDEAVYAAEGQEMAMRA